jgi:hypothetical protein
MDTAKGKEVLVKSSLPFVEKLLMFLVGMKYEV